MEMSESFIFPARRAQWIVSSLAYHYGIDRGVENEIVVLAAGLDQYLQEIFHHLDSSANSQLQAQDFEILCDVLGLTNSDSDRESHSLLKDLPLTLGFKEFHVRLGEYFASQAKTNYTPVPECTHDVEHIESDVRVRHPRTGLTVHTMCVECFSSKPITEIYKSLLHSRGKSSWEIKETVGENERNPRSSRGLDTRDARAKLALTHDELLAMEKLEQQLTNAQEENESLREVIEDMRLALQSSDARSLAMQVALRKSHLKHKKCEVQGNKYSTRSPITPSRSIDALIYELNHLRESRDLQLEEAMQFTQQLEIDLLKSRKELLDLEYGNNVLISNQRAMYQELAKARKIVEESLAKVRELEEQSKQTPGKQHQKLLSVKQELDHRSLMENSDGDMPQDCKESSHTCQVSHQSERTSPAGDSDTSGGDNQSEGSTTSEDQMFRAVEGRAASDEENQWQENVENDEVFEKTENNVTLEKLQIQNEELMEQLEKSEETRLATEEEMEEMKADLFQEIQLRIQDCEVLQYELQTLETERVRLSLVEETLMEIVALLRELRTMKMSRRSLGKIVMDTIEICHYGNRDMEPEHDVRNFVNCLHKQLIHCDLLQEAFAARRAAANMRMEPCAETLVEQAQAILEAESTTGSQEAPTEQNASGKEISTDTAEQQTLSDPQTQPSKEVVPVAESKNKKENEPWMEIQKIAPLKDETSKSVSSTTGSGTAAAIPWLESTKTQPCLTERPKLHTYSIDRETVC
ncbi:EF-hand and coiled-coil domain-containing protein 1-like [Ptychodera flava]|uniref:EF-hand and coiled-coil domain-containing protein 1-like n=1 Tax=Ptychodera flava TaxID=63121 RepID=UPI00396A3FD2